MAGEVPALGRCEKVLGPGSEELAIDAVFSAPAARCGDLGARALCVGTMMRGWVRVGLRSEKRDARAHANER